MHKDQVIGGLLLTASIIVIITYAWLMFFPPLAGADVILLKLTGVVAVFAVFAILAWIGFTLATTPPPRPIEEIEEELKNVAETAIQQKDEGGS